MMRGIGRAIRIGVTLVATVAAATGALARDGGQRLPAIVLYSAPLGSPIVTPVVIDRMLSVRDRFAVLKGHTHEVRLGWGPLALSAVGSRLHGREASPDAPFRLADRISAGTILMDAALDCGGDFSLHVFSLAQRTRRRLGSSIGTDRSFGNRATAIGVEADRAGFGSIVLDYTKTRTGGRSVPLARLFEEVASGTPGGTMARLSFGNARAVELPGRLTWTASAAVLQRSPADGDLWSGGPRIDRRAQIVFLMRL